MTKAQKNALRDLFEGGFDLQTAIDMANIASKQAWYEAYITWKRWQREMDEEGSYTF